MMRIDMLPSEPDCGCIEWREPSECLVFNLFIMDAYVVAGRLRSTFIAE